MAAGVTIWIPPGGRRGSRLVVRDPLDEVREPVGRREPEPDSVLDSSVVAEALASVEESAELEPVASGASVIVPVAESDPAEEDLAVAEDARGDEVSVGVSEKWKESLSRTDKSIILKTTYHLQSLVVASQSSPLCFSTSSAMATRQ